MMDVTNNLNAQTPNITSEEDVATLLKSIRERSELLQRPYAAIAAATRNMVLNLNAGRAACPKECMPSILLYNALTDEFIETERGHFPQGAKTEATGYFKIPHECDGAHYLINARKRGCVVAKDTEKVLNRIAEYIVSRRKLIPAIPSPEEIQAREDYLFNELKVAHDDCVEMCKESVKDPWGYDTTHIDWLIYYSSPKNNEGVIQLATIYDVDSTVPIFLQPSKYLQINEANGEFIIPFAMDPFHLLSTGMMPSKEHLPQIDQEIRDVARRIAEFELSYFE